MTVDIDPDRLSYVHAVRVMRRKLPLAVAMPPSPLGHIRPSMTP